MKAAVWDGGARARGGRLLRYTSMSATAQSDAIALRVKLLRGSEGAEIGADGMVVGLTGRAATEQLLQLQDRILDYNSSLHGSSKCEVTLLRRDLGLAEVAREYQPPAGVSLNCFRLTKVPLRRQLADADDVTVTNHRIIKLQGKALADALLRVDDLVVGMDGRRVDGAALVVALRKTSNSLSSIQVLRRCAEHDVNDKALERSSLPNADGNEAKGKTRIAADDLPTRNDGADAAKAGASSSDIAPAGVTAAPTADSSPAAPSTRLIDTASDGTSKFASQSVRLSGPSRRVEGARRMAAADASTLAAFEPLDDKGSIWSDLPGGADETAACPMFDPGSGVWSDVPCEPNEHHSGSNHGGTAAPRSAQSARALLDVMIRQALTTQDDQLLRRLVSAQQSLPASPDQLQVDLSDRDQPRAGARARRFVSL